MAGYVLHLSTEENITLSSATVKRLIAGGSGDAALLYLAILHARGAADSGKLARELKWDETRLRAAEQALYEMKCFILSKISSTSFRFRIFLI